MTPTGEIVGSGQQVGWWLLAGGLAGERSSQTGVDGAAPSLLSVLFTFPFRASACVHYDR